MLPTLQAQTLHPLTEQPMVAVGVLRQEQCEDGWQAVLHLCTLRASYIGPSNSKPKP